MDFMENFENYVDRSKNHELPLQRVNKLAVLIAYDDKRKYSNEMQSIQTLELMLLSYQRIRKF